MGSPLIEPEVSSTSTQGHLGSGLLARTILEWKGVCSIMGVWWSGVSGCAAKPLGTGAVLLVSHRHFTTDGLGRPDLSGEIEERYRKETDVRSKVRLLCVKLAATGGYTREQVAEIFGKSQSWIFVWFKAFRENGFEGLLGREHEDTGDGRMDAF